MMAIERRLKAAERHHRGSVLSFSSECRFEPPGLSGKHPDSSFQTGVGAVGFPPARLESDTSRAGPRASALTADGHRYPSGGAMCGLAAKEAPANAGQGHGFVLVFPPIIDFKIGRAIAIRYRYASGVVNEGGAYATRFDRFSAQVPPSRPKSPQPLRRSRCHRGGSIGHTPIDRPHLVKALQIARTLP